MYQINTYYGNTVDFQNPCIDQIDIRDIAHNLSFENRFLGQTEIPYSVAQHCVLGSAILEETGYPDLALVFLLHDASEAYVKDIPTPLKKLLGVTYSSIESIFQVKIFQRFNLNPFDIDRPEIKKMDLIMLATEKKQLLPNGNLEWPQLKDIPTANIYISPWSHEVAEREFLAQFNKLIKEVNNGWS
ncbi:hypothetical protein [Pasteurella sp. PK-2025]|uniref:hypothetical protein n=1 Tax=unclassified Pasteurella TaxID=2621516 RepID=UPI003C7191CD